MRQAQVIQWMSAVALAATWPGAPALAAQCENGVCKLDDHAQVAHADHDKAEHGTSGMACCKDGQGACCKTNGGKGEACCQAEHGEAHHDQARHEEKHGDACCSTDGGKSGDACCAMDDHDGKGHMGMNGQMGMMHSRWGAHFRNAQKIAELRFLPGVGAPGTTTNNFLVLGGGIQSPGEVFSIAWQHNLAVQLNPSGGAGNWVAPYAGIVPRLGVQLGTARVDVGVLGGFGAMVRTLGNVVPGAQVVDERFQWVLEPRIELGMKNDRMGVALVGSYMLTPNMDQMGGVGAGLKFTFKGHGW